MSDLRHYPSAGERRHLTVVFLDLVGSTVLAQSMDPEDLRDVLAGFLATAGRIVCEWDGHVARTMGDGLLAYFGWPSAREDDAERAIRAGLEVLDAVAALPPVAARCSEGLSVRIGMHTGAAVVDRDGEIFGDTAHIAARVQSACEPGCVFATEATAALVDGYFETEERGFHVLKGVREPMRLVRILGRTGVRRRIGASSGELTRLVAREPDLSVLLDSWRQASGSCGGSVVVRAEAGVGKSRLVQELRNRLASEPHFWLECGGAPFTSKTPFHPVISLLSRSFGLRQDEPDGEKVARIEKRLGASYSADELALLGDLLGVRPFRPLPMSPELQRRATLDLLVRCILDMPQDKPLVLIVEDLHWCDASTLELAGLLTMRAAAARALLVFTVRTDFQPPWLGSSGLRTIDLSRLTESQASEMVGILGGGELSPATVAALVERADGVPLYIEELTRSVLDPARRQVETLPATLADALMSRLDRLSTAKDVAQKAAVLGREFSHRLLAGICDMTDSEVRLALDRLREAEIVYPTGDAAGQAYVFKHALVQEAAYASLLKRTRQQLHARAAGLLESSEESTTPEVIARHFELAGVATKAADRYLQAGQLATRRHAHDEAIALFERALGLVESMPASEERDRRELKLRMAAGAPLVTVRSWSNPTCTANYERARELASSVGNSPELSRALSSLAATYFVRGKLDLAVELAEQAIQAAYRTGDSYDVLSGHNVLAVPLLYRGDFRRSLEHALHAVQIWDPAVHAEYAYDDGADRGVFTFVENATCWTFLGYPDWGLELAREGVAIAERLAHPLSIAHATFVLGSIHYHRKEFDPALEVANRGTALAERFGFPFHVAYFQLLRGGAWSFLGEPDRGVSEIQRAFGGFAGTESGIAAPMAIRLLADAQRVAGQLDEALASCDLGLMLADRDNQHFDDAELLRVRAEVLLERGAVLDDVEVVLKRALAIAQSQEAKFWELRSANVLAQVRILQGRGDGARAILEPLVSWFSQGRELADCNAARKILESVPPREPRTQNV